MNKKNVLYFIAYLIFTTALSTVVHRDVIFNSYSFGRHWDWTFLSFVEMYQNYVRSFFYTIGNDALGSYGTISPSDFIVKEAIIFLHKIFTSISIPVLNKAVVFVLFPVLSSLGIWNLVKTVLKNNSNTDNNLTFLITNFANILYTFSLPLIYDLHGGALNRQVSTIALPFLFALIYRYIKLANSSRFLILCAALSIFLDISNIFYISIIIAIAILFKPSTLYSKIKDSVAYGLSLIMVNSYWIQSIFLSQAVNPVQILKERRLEVDILKNYSAPFKQLLFLTSTPHNLIESVFKNSFIIYIPALSALFIALWLLLTLIKQGVKKITPEFLLTFYIFIFTSILVGGTHSIGNLYMLLYSLPMLGFIQNSVRFSPNLNLSLVYFLIVLLSFVPNFNKKALLKFILIIVVIWVIFLTLNGNLIQKTYVETTKESSTKPFVMNNEIGSLYKPDSSLLERLEGDMFIGNIIPIPSLTSPIYINNYYPKTSQGSDSEVEYDKGFFHTAGNDTKLEKDIRLQLASNNPSYPLQLMNVQYVWVSGNYMDSTKESVKNHFSRKWLTKVLAQPNTPLVRDEKLNSLYKVKREYLTPVIHAESMAKGRSNMVVEYKRINETKYLVVVHNPTQKFNLVFNKQYYRGWKAGVVSKVTPQKSLDLVEAQSYHISEPNIFTQANIFELNSFIQKGYISSLGDGKEKIIQFHTYKNGNKARVKEDRSKIGYVSKLFKNSIQNNNLIEPKSQYKVVNLPESDHLMINSFANSWRVDTSKVCGSIDCAEPYTRLEIILEYYPQRTYELALIISGISLVICFFIFIKKTTKAN